MRAVITILMLLASCREHLSRSGSPIPSTLQQYLHTNLPGWKLVDTADYDKSWWSFYDRTHIPYIVSTDINNDRLADHALLLKKDKMVQLLICMGAPQGGYTPIAAAHFNITHALSYGLAVQPPAQIDVMDPREQSLMLASNGIALIELEQPSRVYYWQNGLQTFYMK